MKQHVFSKNENNIGSFKDFKKIGFFTYYWLKFKYLFLKSKSPTLQIIEKINEFQKNIFNESTIYKLYVDNEKLKLLLLNDDQRTAFEKIKLGYKTVFSRGNENQDTFLLSQRLGQKNTKLDQNIIELLKSTS